MHGVVLIAACWRLQSYFNGIKTINILKPSIAKHFGLLKSKMNKNRYIFLHNVLKGLDCRNVQASNVLILVGKLCFLEAKIG